MSEKDAGVELNKASFYRDYVKRALDVAISSVAIVALSPVLGAVAVAIKVDSPGPVFFKQKRVGNHKTYFEIYKFRSMRADTPKDVPTHQLGSATSHITRVGAFIRKTSIDELPQLFNILKGDMSFVGPRPCLWNQYDLIEERDRYGANDVIPGLTGWAQVNGRDELEIPVKAKYDGEYASNPSFKMDARCFLATIGSVLTSDGVVEGGTGEMEKGTGEVLTEQQQDDLVPPEKLKREVAVGGAVAGAASVVGVAGTVAVAKHIMRGKPAKRARKQGSGLKAFAAVAAASLAAFSVASAVYDQKKKRALERDRAERETRSGQPATFCIEGSDDMQSNNGASEASEATVQRPIRVLITGAGSYIGTHVEQWLAQWPDRFEVESIDMKDPVWRDASFAKYDVIYHVAGIAHADVGSVTPEQQAKYYAVNTDLAVETAKKAKAEGVKQFILMSSMIVYGGKDFITSETVPEPAIFYGDSKWQADQRVRELAEDGFKVAVLRPPMIYGRGSKGNYPQLAKLAVKLPAFPQVRNRRSMLHIDNLCEFVRLIIEDGAEGVFFPQNREYVCTSDMVREIARVRGHKIAIVPGMSLPAAILEKVPGKVGGLASKAFGDSAYDLAMSEYPRDYRVRSFEESIELTEGEDTSTSSRHVTECTGRRKKKVMFITAATFTIPWFRADMLKEFTRRGCDVIVLGNEDDPKWIPYFKDLGVRYRTYPVSRNGLSPREDFETKHELKQIIAEEAPDIVLTNFVKANVYGCIASHEVGITEIYVMMGGLGTVFHGKGIKSRLVREVVSAEYRASLKYAKKIFFQNDEDAELLVKGGCVDQIQVVRINGSGVNLEQFEKMKLLDKASFVFIGRLVRGKGVVEYLEAARDLKNLYPDAEFNLVGPFDTNPTALKPEELQGYIDEGIVVYHGEQKDVRPFLKNASVFVLPSYYGEGTPKSGLEAMAAGRPLIVADAVGCREVVEDGRNGYLVEPKSVSSLVAAMKKLAASPDLRERMGVESRKIAEERFDVRKVNEIICRAMGIGA